VRFWSPGSSHPRTQKGGAGNPARAAFLNRSRLYLTNSARVTAPSEAEVTVATYFANTPLV
jgi:hypothetical protein